jgi:anti-sigma factor RsiW
MTCPEIHSLLPAHIYGDLPADEADVVARHLLDCPACRAEAATLTGVRTALDATPTPPVRVDVAAMFANVADHTVRRWRRFALAGAALAAGLLVVLGLRLHVTVGNGQIVIAWGEGSGVSRDAEALRS